MLVQLMLVLMLVLVLVLMLVLMPVLMLVLVLAVKAEVMMVLDLGKKIYQAPLVVRDKSEAISSNDIT